MYESECVCEDMCKHIALKHNSNPAKRLRKNKYTKLERTFHVHITVFQNVSFSLSSHINKKNVNK